MKSIKKSSVRKAQSGASTKSAARKEYDEAYAKHKAGREAIGKNDKSKLEAMGSKGPYGKNDLAKDYNKAQSLRKKAGLGQIESAKLAFPQVGQQLRGTVNKMMGTNYKKGGTIKKSSKKK